ncbi:MAG TPA: cytochrome P460 family protein [Kofleriaceae bacterium]|nr:cytochrome P460 family protein [Kofleriaceae bacterium]
MARHAVLAIFVGRLLAACGGDDGGGGDPPLFPADYAATYQQVRNCRNSLDHDLMRIRVLASPDALQPYTGRTAPFPAGAIVLKEQYADSDTACAGPIVKFTVMQKLEGDGPAGSLGWSWQEVNADRRVNTESIARCTGCHADCGKPPEGYAGTCTVP